MDVSARRLRGVFFAALIAPFALLLAACAPAVQGIVAGASAPAFTLPDARGGEVSLSQFQGQPVLLFFHMAVG